MILCITLTFVSRQNPYILFLSLCYIFVHSLILFSYWGLYAWHLLTDSLSWQPESSLPLDMILTALMRGISGAIFVCGLPMVTLQPVSAIYSFFASVVLLLFSCVVLSLWALLMLLLPNRALLVIGSIRSGLWEHVKMPADASTSMTASAWKANETYREGDCVLLPVESAEPRALLYIIAYGMLDSLKGTFVSRDKDAAGEPLQHGSPHAIGCFRLVSACSVGPTPPVSCSCGTLADWTFNFMYPSFARDAGSKVEDSYLVAGCLGLISLSSLLMALVSLGMAKVRFFVSFLLFI